VSGASGSPVLDATGVTLSTSVETENQYYRQAAPDIRPGSTVRISFRMRSVSSSSSTSSRAGALVGFAFGPARSKNSLYIGTDEIFLLSAENTRGNAASVPTTDAMHDYVIDVNIGAGTVSVSYDGAPTLTGALFINAPDTTTDYITWGDGSLFATGTSVWSRFEHDAWAACGAP